MRRHFVKFRPVAKPRGKRVLCVSRGQLLYVELSSPVYFKAGLGHYEFRLARDFTLFLYEYGLKVAACPYEDIYFPRQVFCFVDRLGNPSRVSFDVVSDVFTFQRRMCKG